MYKTGKNKTTYQNYIAWWLYFNLDSKKAQNDEKLVF